MEENKNGIDERLEKLAMITDALETLFPNGQTAIILELEKDEFKSVQKNFRDIDRNHKRFKIEISNIEIIFMQAGVNFEEKVEEPKKEKKVSGFKKIFKNLFTSKISG
jgi:hypothetical protein